MFAESASVRFSAHNKTVKNGGEEANRYFVDQSLDLCLLPVTDKAVFCDWR